MMAHLAKLHATGNDFLVTTAPLTARHAVALCDRFTGIGADGLLLLQPGAEGADATMTLFNADGGVAEMSGNGARCLAWLARRTGMGTPTRLVVDTGGGRRVMELECDEQGGVRWATCDMGAITFDPEAIPLAAPSPFGVMADLDGREVSGDCAGVGNPHWVLFVDDPATVDVARHGSRLEHDTRFPKRVNVEFVAVTATDVVTMRVWERGVGETQSCGTGACAAAALAHRRGLVGEQVMVNVPGGVLQVSLGDTVLLGGPVVHVFDVEIDVDLHIGSAPGEQP